MPAEDVRLDLPEEAIEELVGLSRTGDKLALIANATEKVGPRVGTKIVAETISDEVGIPVAELRPLIRAILNLYHTQVRLKVDTAKTVSAITDNIKRKAKSAEDAERLKAWQAGQDCVVKAVSRLHPDHPLEAGYKALQIASASQYDLVAKKILTDIRPVFNEDGSAIVQSVVSHVLSLDYHDGHTHHCIQFTLDATDVAELRDLCERAERKAAVIKRKLRHDLAYPRFSRAARTD